MNDLQSQLIPQKDPCIASKSCLHTPLNPPTHSLLVLLSLYLSAVSDSGLGPPPGPALCHSPAIFDCGWNSAWAVWRWISHNTFWSPWGADEDFLKNKTEAQDDLSSFSQYNKDVLLPTAPPAAILVLMKHQGVFSSSWGANWQWQDYGSCRIILG